MKGSLILLAISTALLVAGILLDGLPGVALVGAANVCSLTALVREIRRGRKENEDGDPNGR